MLEQLPIVTPTVSVSAGAAELIGAIGHPKRLTLVALLARAELCVCELIERLGWPQPLMSHHLAALRQVGLVRDRRDGRWIYYSLDPTRLAELRDALGLVLGDGPLPPAAAYGANRRCGP